MRSPSPDLLEMSLELTVYGVMLAVIMPLTSHRLDAVGVATICCFLASVFVFKLFSPIRVVSRYFWGRVGSVVLCSCFAWWLIYQAENTRTGWYRFHVLQTRVQQFVSKAPAYVITADCDGFITGSSDNIASLIGWSKGEIMGRHMRFLMRDEPAKRHDAAYKNAISILRADGSSPNAGWTLQGVITVGIRHKEGRIVPVHAYAGGIRWSQQIQFTGDIDMFAVFIPVSEEEAHDEPTTILPGTPLKVAPPPPPTPVLAPRPLDEVEAPIDAGKSPLMSRPGTRGVVLPSRTP
jgi:PAS domain S-box-containing protein